MFRGDISAIVGYFMLSLVTMRHFMLIIIRLSQIVSKKIQITLIKKTKI